MARRKASSLASLTRKVVSRKRKPRPAAAAAPRSNPSSAPSFWAETGNLVVPGLIGYTGVRLSGRIAYKLGKRKSVAWARHLGALTPVLTASGVILAAHKLESLSEYQQGLVIGSAIAATQSVLQTYLPQWSWFVNDYHLDDVLPLAPPPGELPNGNGVTQPSIPDSSPDAGVEDNFEDIPELAGAGFNMGIFS